MNRLFQRLSVLLNGKVSNPCEARIGYRFKNPVLLEEALRHRSYAYSKEHDRIKSNERLEFLGDAVLELVITDHLFRTYPKKMEGDLSQIKSLVVSKKVLKREAEKTGLGQDILLSPSEEKTGGRKRSSILADAYEAVIAAIYLDGGLEPARAFIERTVIRDMDEYLSDQDNVNYKSKLLEKSQKRQFGSPVYEVQSEKGPDHNKTFLISVLISGKECGTGTGRNKKAAEQEAARNALKKFDHLLKKHSVEEPKA